MQRERRAIQSESDPPRPSNLELPKELESRVLLEGFRGKPGRNSYASERSSRRRLERGDSLSLGFDEPHVAVGGSNSEGEEAAIVRGPGTREPAARFLAERDDVAVRGHS